MKNLIFFLLLLIPCTLPAQVTEFGSFKIMDAEIIYQKVFTQDSITANRLVEFLKTLPTIANAKANGETVTADLIYLTVDYKKYNVAQSAVPPIIQSGKFSGKLTFEIKSGKYRTTLRSIKMKGDTGTKKINEPESITDYACVDDGTALSPVWCKPNTFGLLDRAITDRLKYKETNTDWK